MTTQTSGSKSEASSSGLAKDLNDAFVDAGDLNKDESQSDKIADLPSNTLLCTPNNGKSVLSDDIDGDPNAIKQSYKMQMEPVQELRNQKIKDLQSQIAAVVAGSCVADPSVGGTHGDLAVVVPDDDGGTKASPIAKRPIPPDADLDGKIKLLKSVKKEKI
ncbi:uncharacterized protein LOC130726756 [Lotus japonicus]|uniref:uncharacterized protein LOC130726756 n=1 Tax=Lotus japonicus TaxID=34305 RepID=UPI00258F0AE8|nr:uncharacterized protein LOC130726756 [Lotus japonicus]